MKRRLSVTSFPMVVVGACDGALARERVTLNLVKKGPYMSTLLKRTAGVFVAAAIMSGLVAAPAVAGDVPAGDRKCKAVLVGNVDAGAVVKIHDGTLEKSAVVAKALVNAKIKLCVKLNVDADVVLTVKKDFDANGKLIAVNIFADVKAKANGVLDIEVKLIGDTYVNVGGKIVLGVKLVVKLDAKVVVVANVALRVKARVELFPLK